MDTDRSKDAGSDGVQRVIVSATTAGDSVSGAPACPSNIWYPRSLPRCSEIRARLKYFVGVGQLVPSRYIIVNLSDGVVSITVSSLLNITVRTDSCTVSLSEAQLSLRLGYQELLGGLRFLK